ncbi:hypothetical protein H112_05539 [Trichophyton rubrum D6]|uniref:Uncharacterized protein n=3 Tax=Trichophyton TaxID=5550 RepID=F2SJS0_TRIRC|nr:uncharacterized protein TERG_03278 [Trichophyton rubrum CBS 118892]EZF16893.1 hypothetical protein H100_05556 [Trichophyton rubrum MR850]EZF40492.1 hypothetical protein H102_05524 [Trichophyton rubrum CBS 100081]EZF51177.1 hypothetical protein H103_05547 [Trichophyton rubrum CBS 288.86]EZF61716.1 hypothetical protein H104_05538 [Trichophyton rubrum CBS 289.86]EZF72391.1 hypothetical protein H105_05565 [Trichophyton soudanense CBS 452.61]EZF82852.1 hypothetical protein H110_05546 [Trichophy
MISVNTIFDLVYIVLQLPYKLSSCQVQPSQRTREFEVKKGSSPGLKEQTLSQSQSLRQYPVPKEITLWPVECIMDTAKDPNSSRSRVSPTRRKLERGSMVMTKDNPLRKTGITKIIALWRGNLEKSPTFVNSWRISAKVSSIPLYG